MLWGGASESVYIVRYECTAECLKTGQSMGDSTLANSNEVSDLDIFLMSEELQSGVDFSSSLLAL